MKRIILLLIFLVAIEVKADNYAFLISAGQSDKDDEPTNSEYWYDLFLAYEDLILKEGYSHERVVVFYGNGQDWTGTRYQRYKKELHNWQDPIVDYNNSVESLEQVFSNYSNIITDNDNVLIRWVVGHGGLYGLPWTWTPDSYFVLIENTGEIISKSQLLNIINQINHFNRRKILWMTCHSGCIVKGNQNFNENNTTIITSSDWDEPSYPFLLYNESVHAEFNYVETSSLYEVDPLGAEYDADGNSDKVINFNELYIEALNSPIMHSEPQIGDLCPMANYLFVDEELVLANTQLEGNIKYRVDRFEGGNGLEIIDNSFITIACDKEIVFKPGFVSYSGSNLHSYIGYIQCPPAGIIQPIASKNEPLNLSADKSLSIHPNPFNSDATISIDVHEEGNLSLKVMDMLGNSIFTFADNEFFTNGIYNFTLNSANIPSGLYFVLLQTRDEVITQKVMVMK